MIHHTLRAIIPCHTIATLSQSQTSNCISAEICLQCPPTRPNTLTAITLQDKALQRLKLAPVCLKRSLVPTASGPLGLQVLSQSLSRKIRDGVLFCIRATLCFTCTEMCYRAEQARLRANQT